MIVEEKTDEFKKCVCGHKPSEYSIGYGRTPYNFICKCGKQLNDAKCEITGSVSNMFSYWNDKLRLMTVGEVKEEANSFNIQKEKVEGENMQKAKEYKFYWFKGEGEKLIESW